MTPRYEVRVTDIIFTGEANSEDDALNQTLNFLNGSEFIANFDEIKVERYPD